MQFVRSRLLVLASLFALVLVAGAFVACGDDDNASNTPTATAGGATTAPASGTHTAAATTPAASGGAVSNPLSPCPPASGATSLTADGSTFVQPFFTDIFQKYQTQCNIQVNYQGVGSGQGIKDLTAKSVDFADSDAIMTADQKTAAGGTVLHIPVTSDAVAIVYNIPGVASKALTVDGPTLAKIYLGQITKWNDPAITALNAGVTLPDMDITTVHRSDGSGTTFIFTNYLSKISTDWQSQVGNATSVTWPGSNTAGAQGNSGVAGQVQQTSGSIGYVSFGYVLANNLSYANFINAAGKSVLPSIDSARAAQQGITLPDNMEVMITNSSDPAAYPISGFTWMLVYQTQTDQAKAISLAHVLSWAITDAQQYAAADSYVAMSSVAQQKALAELATVTYNGTPITQLQ